jgi:hypothetical protein
LRTGLIIAIGITIVLAIGAIALLVPQLGGGRGIEPDIVDIGLPETQAEGPERSASTETPEPEAPLILAETEDGRFQLYVIPNDAGHYTQLYLAQESGEPRAFEWQLHDYDPAFAPELYVFDLNKDAADELIVLLNNPQPDGVRTQELHVLDANDLHEMTITPAAEHLEQTVQSQILPRDGYVWVRLDVNGTIYEKAFDATRLQNWGEQINFNYATRYTVLEKHELLQATVEAVIGEGAEQLKLGAMEVGYQLAAQGVELVTNFQMDDKISGEIPLLAIQTDGGYIGLRDRDNEVDLPALLGKPHQEIMEQLGADAATFKGMHTKKLIYDGLELELYSVKGDTYYLVNMKLTGDNYPTSLGVQVGDTVEQVKQVYPFIEIALDGRKPPNNFAFALSRSMYENMYIDIKNGVVNEIYFEYLID